MNLLQGPVGHSLPPPTEAGPGFQSGNKFDIDMCVLAAQGNAGAGGRGGGGLTSWWPTCLPCQWQQQCDGRRRNRKQRTENENRKQKTKQQRKQLKSYVKKVGKCKHCLVACQQSLKVTMHATLPQSLLLLPLLLTEAAQEAQGARAQFLAAAAHFNNY